MSAAAMTILRKRLAEAHGYRISPGDTNYFALLLDPAGDAVDLTCVVEIFNPGGRTPPKHAPGGAGAVLRAQGTGRAHCGGRTVELAPGDALLVPPGHEHVIENTGAGKLYTLTVMIPNEGFAELIRNGTPVPLDAEDRALLNG
jgi:quercetin dioxygenase-like cupin family protein